MDVASTAQDAVSRVDKFYLLNRQSKRIQAAEEGLDQISASPGMAPAVQVVKTMVSAAPEEVRVPMLRAGLVHLGERAAVLASGQVAPLAGLALAVYSAPETPAAASGKAGLEALSTDPLAATLANAGGGAECFAVLTRERPSDPAGLAGFGASLKVLPSAPRVAGQRFVVHELGAQMLEGLPDGALQPGLDRLAENKSLVAAAAGGLATTDVSKHSQTFLDTLSEGWQDWTLRLLSACKDDNEKGRVLQTCLRGAEAMEGRAQTVGDLLKAGVSDGVAAVLSDGLEETNARLADWNDMTSRLGMTGLQQAQGALAQVKDANLKPYQAAAQLLPPDKAGALLGELAAVQDTAPLAGGLQALVTGGGDPKLVLGLIAKPQPLAEMMATMDTTLGKIADKPRRLEVATECLGHWAGLTLTPDEADTVAYLQALDSTHDPVNGADIALRYGYPALKGAASCKGDKVAYVAQRLTGSLKNVVDHNQAAEQALETLKGRHPETVAMVQEVLSLLPQEDQKKVLLAKTLKDLAEVANPTPLVFARSVLKAGGADPAHFVFMQVATRRLAASGAGQLQPQLAMAASLGALRSGYPAELRGAVQRILDGAEATPASLPRKLGLLAQTGTKALTSDGADQIALGRLCLEEVGKYCDLRTDLPACGVLKQVQELSSVRLPSVRQEQAFVKALVDGIALADVHDPGWMATALLGVTALEEASVKALLPGITKALSGAARAYRDDKLAPPVLDRLQLALAQGGDPRPILKAHLTELARFKGDPYVILAQSQPETMKQVEEQSDAVIVGGVRVKKAATE